HHQHDEGNERETEKQTDGCGAHGDDAASELLRRPDAEPLAVEEAAGAESVELNLAGEPFAQRPDFFDDDALEAKGEQLFDGKLAALAFHGDDDAMDGLVAP